jgi:hypothetical protein
VDDDTQDPMKQLTRLDEQILVDGGTVSKSSLDVEIEGLNITLAEYYENIRPLDDLV